MYLVLSLYESAFLLIVGVLFGVLDNTLGLLLGRAYDSLCVALTLLNACCDALLEEESITHADTGCKRSYNKDNNDDWIHTVHYLLFVKISKVCIMF